MKISDQMFNTHFDKNRKVLYTIGRFITLVLFVHLFTPEYLFAQTNWEQEYNRLKQKIESEFEEPPVGTGDLGTHLAWMDIKGKDLAKAKQLLDEANRLYVAHPENKNYNLWTSKFLELVQRAEESGTATVNGASIRFIFIDGHDDWYTPLWKVHEHGRKIYTKAKENGFSTIYPEQRSICLLNYSLGMLESDQKNEDPMSGSGFSLYRGRLLLDGIPVNGGKALSIPDFLDSSCDGRKMFYRWTEGEPDKTIMYAFTNVDKIREECKWWGFGDIWQDATDLMNEYYEDALCKIPPHEYKLGHKYFLQLAEEKDLEKSINYNKGFYGTLYGKVEILIDGSKEPAPGAKVTVDDYDEIWKATADENGRYKIEKVILHKDCSPFDISARYKGYHVDDTYEGPLTKPDSTARYRKDLLIKPGINYKWSGSLTVLQTKNSHCLENITKDLRIQQVRLRIRARHIDISQPIIAIDLGDMNVTGFISGKYEYVMEEEGGDDRHYRHVIENNHGMNSFSFTKDDQLQIQIISEKMTDPDAMKKMAEMAKKVAMGNYSEKEIEKIASQMEDQVSDDRKSFPVRVIVQLNGNWRGRISTYEYIYETENGNVIENKENNGAFETDLVLPIALEMKGTCTKSQNGEVSIQAHVYGSNGDSGCSHELSSGTFTIKRSLIKQ